MVPTPTANAVSASAGPDDVADEVRQPGDLAEPAGRRLGVGERVELPGDQHQADAGQHALHHGERDRPEPAAAAAARPWPAGAVRTSGRGRRARATPYSSTAS